MNESLMEYAEPITKACDDCQTEFTYRPAIVLGRTMFRRRYCEACDAKQQIAETARQKSEERAMIEERWNAVCPPLYRDTDLARINPSCAQAARQWACDGSRGLGLLGGTGAGKTRALFVALRRAFDAGKSVRSISHNSFSRLVQAVFAGEGRERGEAKDVLSSLHKCDVLLLDDLGKPPPTERADAELEELVELRTSHLRPILWSANGSSAWLIKRMGPDRGEPLVRRLSEFSDIPKV